MSHSIMSTNPIRILSIGTISQLAPCMMGLTHNDVGWCVTIPMGSILIEFVLSYHHQCQNRCLLPTIHCQSVCWSKISHCGKLDISLSSFCKKLPLARRHKLSFWRVGLQSGPKLINDKGLSSILGLCPNAEVLPKVNNGYWSTLSESAKDFQAEAVHKQVIWIFN